MKSETTIRNTGMTLKTITKTEIFRPRPRSLFFKSAFAFAISVCAPGFCPAQDAPQMARSVAAALGAQGRLMWIDGTANLTRTIKRDGQTVVIDYTTTLAGVKDVVAKCKAAHVNTLVVDVKPLSGHVLFNSRVAPKLREWKGRPVPDFDVLAAFVEEGHKAGLQVDASINILSEGHKLFKTGPAYDHPSWQSIVYTLDRGMVAPNGDRLNVRIPGEPSDPSAPSLLTGASNLLRPEPTSGLVGLESVDSKTGVINSAEAFGKQMNLILDGSNRVTGMIDSALLGDDPLIAPEGGHLLPAVRDEDREWFAKNLKPGSKVGFDQRTLRLPITKAPSEKISCFINPLHPEARRHELDLVREIVSGYKIDGLVLDRCRFSNLYNDFSELTRDAFEQWLRARRSPKTLSKFPQDVFAFPSAPGGKMKLGPLYKEWLEFRASTIRDFVGEVCVAARSLKPGIVMGTYVGSWYPSYYEVGVNWGSPKTRLRYSWFTPEYPKTGYAEYFDWISTGCYYPTATKEEAYAQGLSEKSTVEFASQLSDLAVSSGAFVYAGIYVTDYTKNPDAFLRALQAAGKQSQGWMVFDLTYVNEYDWWSHLEKAYAKPSPSPDTIAELLAELRSGMDALP